MHTCMFLVMFNCVFKRHIVVNNFQCYFNLIFALSPATENGQPGELDVDLNVIIQTLVDTGDGRPV